MKRTEVNIRDPYVLPYGGKYYLYGTRSATSWGPAEGFDCYVSEELENWDGPFEIFHRPEGFWAVQNYWAPECYFHNGAFCLITTLADEAGNKSINLLSSDSPLGPFRHVSVLTAPQEQAMDGTLYFENGVPYLVYCNSSLEEWGTMYAARLTDDLEKMAEKPVRLFHASEAPWAKPFPWSKEEFGVDGPLFFADGPAVKPLPDGSLGMFWSSWGSCGYAVGTAVSESGTIAGPWRQKTEPLFPENGGHGMCFERFDGAQMYALHYPNDKYHERPVFLRMCLQGGCASLNAEDLRKLAAENGEGESNG